MSTIAVDDPQSRYFIYGTCVSRDAFEHAGAPPFSTYVARSSLASAFAPVPEELPGFNLHGNPSPFQRRMVEVDVQKQLSGLLDSDAYGRLILDLIDERFDLRIIGGSVITQSQELSKCLPAPRIEELVKSGSPEHKRRFREGLDALVGIVDPARIILNNVHWSEVDEDGVPFANADDIAANNLLLDGFYDLARERGIKNELHYPKSLLAASVSHKWGRSPFHFTDAFYASMLKQLAAGERG